MEAKASSPPPLRVDPRVGARPLTTLQPLRAARPPLGRPRREGRSYPLHSFPIDLLGQKLLSNREVSRPRYVTLIRAHSEGVRFAYGSS